MDAPPIPERAEHVLDLATLLVENAVMFGRCFTVRLRWNARRDSAFGESRRNQSAS
jgi:hypothetical protein